MTRAEYMDKLQEQLEKFGKELQQEIMEDYNRHFAEGEAEGRTDEQIIQELGNIEDMIRELRDTEEAEPEEGAAAVSAPGLQDAGASAKDGGAEERRTASDHSADEGRYRSVVLKTGSADIVLAQSEDDEVHVDYTDGSPVEERMKYEFYQYAKDGVFYAGVRRNRNYFDGTERSFSIGPTTLMFCTSFNTGQRNKNIVLNVRVPKTIPEVRVETSSGNIEMGNLALKKVKAAVSSGDVKVSACLMERLEIGTGSGDIRVEELTAEAPRFTTASGDVQLTNVKGRRIWIMTASGDVACGETTSEKIDVKTASGDVKLQADAGQYRLLATSGDVVLYTGVAPEKVDVTTVSGDIDLDVKAAEGAEVEAGSRSGDIFVSRDGRPVSVRKGTAYTFGNGACKVAATTVSGDIHIAL